MKKTLILAAAALLLAACGNRAQRRADRAAADTEALLPDSRTAEDATRVAGTYTGTLPAADCPGIETRLTLRPNGTYDLHLKYIDRDAAFDEQGAYEVRGDLLTLTPSDGERIAFYRIEKNRLRMLDNAGQAITGELAENYVLHKTDR